MPPNRVASLRWTFAAAPFIIGFGSVAAGGQQWALAFGLVVSVVLHVLAARAFRPTESRDA